MSRFLNKRLISLEEYTPGEQPRDRKYIKLNTNESPFPPAPSVVDAISRSAVESLRLYCDPTAKALKTALANYYSVGSENVFVANGSDDILNFSFLAFGENGAVFPNISYGFYKVFANLHGISYEQKPLLDDFSINVSDYFDTKRLTVLANPNAPTGISLPLSDIEKIVKENAESVVLIDEAYVDFGGESAVNLTKKYDNLLVVMTYSKSRNMAGARLGFAIGSAALISDLEKIKYSTNPYNVNTLTQIAGIETLKADGYYKNCCRSIIENREYTVGELKKLGFYVLNSKANFVFAKNAEIDGKKLYSELYSRGILVRHFESGGICDFNRITIGTRSEMESLIGAISEILKGTDENEMQ
jgi:histidinol-phosphate aminotransferase